MHDYEWWSILILALVGLFQLLSQWFSPKFDKTKIKKFHWLGNPEDHRTSAPPPDYEDKE